MWRGPQLYCMFCQNTKLFITVLIDPDLQPMIAPTWRCDKKIAFRYVCDAPQILGNIAAKGSLKLNPSQSTRQ